MDCHVIACDTVQNNVTETMALRPDLLDKPSQCTGECSIIPECELVSRVKHRASFRVNPLTDSQYALEDAWFPDVIALNRQPEMTLAVHKANRLVRNKKMLVYYHSDLRR
jgi:hypothetical protein